MKRVKLDKLKSKAMREVMTYLFNFQAASYEKRTDDQNVFLWLGQILNDELRIRNPHQNKKLFAQLKNALMDPPPIEKKESKPNRKSTCTL